MTAATRIACCRSAGTSRPRRRGVHARSRGLGDRRHRARRLARRLSAQRGGCPSMRVCRCRSALWDIVRAGLSGVRATRGLTNSTGTGVVSKAAAARTSCDHYAREGPIMPYLNCPRCRTSLYSATTSSTDECPRCLGILGLRVPMFATTRRYEAPFGFRETAESSERRGDTVSR